MDNDIEQAVTNLERRWDREKINNPKACIVVTQLVDGGGCKGCIIEDQCTYEGKYEKVKVRG